MRFVSPWTTNCRAFAPAAGARTSFFGSSFFFGSMSKSPNQIPRCLFVVTGISSERVHQILRAVLENPVDQESKPAYQDKANGCDLRDLQVLLARGLAGHLDDPTVLAL